MPGPKGHAEDAHGPYGWHCHDKRWKRHTERDNSTTPGCQDHDRNCSNSSKHYDLFGNFYAPLIKPVILTTKLDKLQDEEVGDGTTSVIVLAAEVLAVSHRFLEDHIHPTVIIDAYRRALEDAVTILRDKVAFPVDLNDEKEMIKVKKNISLRDSIDYLQFFSLKMCSPCCLSYSKKTLS